MIMCDVHKYMTLHCTIFFLIHQKFKRSRKKKKYHEQRITTVHTSPPLHVFPLHPLILPANLFLIDHDVLGFSASIAKFNHQNSFILQHTANAPSFDTRDNA